MLNTINHNLLLDGGMGHELKKRSHAFKQKLWSASVLIEDPELVCEIHQDFIEAGADVITTNNYTVTPFVLEKNKCLDQFEQLTTLCLSLAKQAVVNTKKDTKIAACLPPLVETYRPDLILDHSQGLGIYSDIISFLESGCDIFLIESMSSISEAKMALDALKKCSKPVWLSFILDDTKPDFLLSGEAISQIESQLNGYHFDALLFNCCHPRSISHALNQLTTSKLSGGYGNAFTPLEKDYCLEKGRTLQEKPSTSAYINEVNTWLNSGASIVGGCCGIGPDTIKKMAKLLY